uniref:Uncharacterized protein n=1 Tax=Cacopsylla melanoneura TaxID=428564 RepID=A0A8D9EX50_9HEMI
MQDFNKTKRSIISSRLFHLVFTSNIRESSLPFSALTYFCSMVSFLVDDLLKCTTTFRTFLITSLIFLSDVRSGASLTSSLGFTVRPDSNESKLSRTSSTSSPIREHGVQ